MKQFLHFSPKYIRLLIVTLAFLAGYSSFGQTPGLILKPATGAGANVLDPDGDGYVSQKTAGQQLGFQSNDVAESELPFAAIVKPDPLGDILKGPQGGFSEIVGTDAAGNNAILAYSDGINIYFRFRLGGYAPNSKAYSLLIDTDQRFGFTGADADPDAIAGNAGFEIEIVLKTNISVDVYNINGTTIGTRLSTYSYDTNCQKSIALSTAGTPANPDYFYDFYVPYPSQFSSSTALRYVATTSMSPSPTIGSSSASDVGGITSSGVSLDQAFAELINAQTPTVPGAEVLDRTKCPTISGSLASGEASVSGASGDNGATIRLYVNDIQVGSTTVNGGTWTITGLKPFVGGDAVKATAQASGKGESASTCNLTFVGSTCSIMPVASSIDNGDKGARVTNIKSYPVGTVFTLYNAMTNTEWSVLGDNNPYEITNTDIARGSIDIVCGTGNCIADGSYYIVAKAPGECESQKAYLCVGTAISSSLIPIIDNTILPLSSYVTGTNGVAGAVMYIYANGTLIGSKTLLSDGTWSVPVPNSMICNTNLTARQIASSQCISATSLEVSIGSAVTSAPIISVDKCSQSITSITGYSGESDGTIIQLYVNGIQRSGTALVSGGKWTFNTSSAITVGQTISARAINNSACKTISEFSAPVTLTGITVLTGTFSIPSSVAEGASSVSVDVSGVTGAYTLSLYIDGDIIGTKSFIGSGTVVVPVTYASDIYTGGNLQVSLTQGTECESALSPVLKTVECNTPNFATSVISAPLTKRCVATSGSITVTNSQKGVIYTPVNDAGIVKGYSVLGTGSTITLTTHPFPASGEATFYVKAQRIVSSGTCEARSATSVSFNAFAPPQFTAHPANKIVCNGEHTTLTATWTGIGPYNVKWQYNNGGGFIDIADGGIFSQAIVTGSTETSANLNISNVSGLDNYTFHCIVTDTSVPVDCQSNTSNTSTLTVPIVTISNALITNSTLGNNGSVDITASGGNGPYLYDWHHLNGSGTFGELEDLTRLSEGTYTVTVKDANGCTYQQSFTVGGTNSINLSFVSQTNVTCYGSGNGRFTVEASSGTEPYSYSIDNFVHSQPSGTFTGLQPGSYIVKARDANSRASNTVLVNITEPNEIIVSAVISNPSVLLNDGSIHLTIDGGTPNFDYELYKSGLPDVLIPGNTDNGRTKSYSNLSVGTYYIQVTDANGCKAFNNNLVLTAPVVKTTQCSHIASHSFNGANNTISGYDGDYNYFASDWIESPLRNEIGIYENALAFGRIPAAGNDTYTWNTPSSIYREIDLQGASNIVLSYKLQSYGETNQDKCTVKLFVNDVEQASYHLNGSDAYKTQSTVTLDKITFNTLSGNSVNKIEFRISSGQSRSNLRIDDFSIAFNKTLSVGAVPTSSTCTNGKIDLSVTGGYPPYRYDWDNDGTGDFNDSQDLSGLAPGTYKVTVKDSRNCTYEQLPAIVVSAPLNAEIASSTNPTCVGGGSNGTITATLSARGGGGPYIYQLYKGASDLVSTVYSAATSKTFTGLTSGTYYVKVTQVADNCNAHTDTKTLTMPVFTSSISAVGSTIICSGNNTTIKVDVTGGTSPYTIELSNGQNITNYTSGAPIVVTPVVSINYTVVSVTDASYCVSSSNIGSVGITVNPPEGSWTGVADRDWNNAANWACNKLPTLETVVTIASGLINYPTLSTGVVGMAKDIIIKTGASVTVDGNILQIAGAISNGGTFDATKGTIEMAGLTTQTIGANVFLTNTLKSLIVNNGAEVTLLGPLNITDVVSPVKGNLNSGGHLTLLSTSGQTALIDGVGTGIVTGTVNMQRYMPSSFGYKYFSSPFKATKVGAFATLVNLTETFPSFYRYDENNSNLNNGVISYKSGWVKYTTATDPLIPMAGYAANLGSATTSKTFAMSGEVNNGPVSLTLYSHDREYTKGFNLVGNPYPSPIDWDAAGWAKDKIDNAIYFFNAGNTDRYTGTYSSYVNKVSTGNANNIIAAMQGFFVHVSALYPEEATLGVTNTVRKNILNPVFKSATIDPRPMMRLTAGFEISDAIEDAAVVYFDPMASMKFEKEKDALKLENTDEMVPNIYTISPDSRKLSINGLSEPSDSVSFIPMGITTFRDGVINFRAEDADDLPFMQVYLADAVTGKYHDLRQSSDVSFSLQRGVYDNRFKLVFSKAPFTGHYPGLGKLFTLVRSGNRILMKVDLPDRSKGNLMVTNLLGQTIMRREVSGKQTVEINQSITTGVFVITLVSGQRTESEKILMRTDYE